jgi:hypothetical protein
LDVNIWISDVQIATSRADALPQHQLKLVEQWEDERRTKVIGVVCSLPPEVSTRKKAPPLPEAP